MTGDAEAPPWWGCWRFETGQARRWRIGPSTLRVQRGRGEWRVVHAREPDPLATSLEVAAPIAAEEFDAAGEPERFVDADGSALRLSPATADRSIVTRPRFPFHLLAGEAVDLYVSSPLWLRLSLEGSGAQLCDAPIHRPSDTWIGSSTLTGEVGYATVTHCRMELAELPLRPHRAVTKVRIRNAATNALQLRRLCVPVPLLSLHAGVRGLWTESVELVRHRDSEELADLVVGERPPAEAESRERLAEPRRRPEKRSLVQAFGLF